MSSIAVSVKPCCRICKFYTLPEYYGSGDFDNAQCGLLTFKSKELETMGIEMDYDSNSYIKEGRRVQIPYVHDVGDGLQTPCVSWFKLIEGLKC